MQEVGNRVLSDDENFSYVIFIKTGNVRRRLSVSDDQIPMVGISLKAQTERINGLLEGHLSHFSAEGLELLDVAQCCYNLTTKKLCVELQPLRVGHGGTLPCILLLYSLQSLLNRGIKDRV